MMKLTLLQVKKDLTKKGLASSFCSQVFFLYLIKYVHSTRNVVCLLSTKYSKKANIKKD